MGVVFPIAEGAVSCRACGATHAPPAKHYPKFGICGDCEDRMTMYCRGKAVGEDEFLGFLTSRLSLSIQRKLQKGIVGRCEAINVTANVAGWQCASPASSHKDGRRVCPTHERLGDKVRFVGAKHSSAYDSLSQIVAELCRADRAFYEAVQLALLDIQP